MIAVFIIFILRGQTELGDFAAIAMTYNLSLESFQHIYIFYFIAISNVCLFPQCCYLFNYQLQCMDRLIYNSHYCLRNDDVIGIHQPSSNIIIIGCSNAVILIKSSIFIGSLSKFLLTIITA